MISQPLTDLDGWRLAFTDDFAVDVPLGRFPEMVTEGWGAYPSPWRDTSDNGIYDPHRVVSIKDSILTKHIHTADGAARVAALMPKHPSMQYGRFAVRWRADKIPGYKIAWMLWPNYAGSPNRQGELDFPEMDLDAPRVGGFVHRKNGTTATQGWVFQPCDINDWHTTVIEWSPGLIVYILDDRELYRTASGVPDTRMHWVIQTETQLGDAPPPPADAKGDVQIDWVAVWKYDPSATEPKPVDTRYVRLVAPAVATGRATLGLDTPPGAREAKWMIAGHEIAWTKAETLSVNWDSNKLPNGIYDLCVKCTDGSSWMESPKRSLTIDNPLVQFEAPTEWIGFVDLTPTVSAYVRELKFNIDGKDYGWRNAAPWGLHFDSSRLANGTHAVYVKVLDANGWHNDRRQTFVVSN